MQDIRDRLFAGLEGRTFRAEITVERDGVLSGCGEALRRARELGVALELRVREGDAVRNGDVIATLQAGPKELAMAEEMIIGTMAKASGIATAARRGVEMAAGRVRIVCGSWKKMPPELKGPVRQAVTAGGAVFRISDAPMIYIDKNFLHMLGSIPAALEAAATFPEHVKVVQIRGFLPVEEETTQALEGGCGIFMVDTGRREDLDRCLATLERSGRRREVQVAFAGNVKLEDIPDMARRDIDLLCIGKEIVDAQLLDMRLDVVEEVIR